jgi:hypothetical protein
MARFTFFFLEFFILFWGFFSKNHLDSLGPCLFFKISKWQKIAKKRNPAATRRLKPNLATEFKKKFMIPHPFGQMLEPFVYLNIMN